MTYHYTNHAQILYPVSPPLTPPSFADSSKEAASTPLIGYNHPQLQSMSLPDHHEPASLFPPGTDFTRDVRSERMVRSPPHTPKGHPLRANSMYGAALSGSPKNPLPLSQPQFSSSPSRSDVKQSQSYRTTLSYLLRIPRKLRPVSLVAVTLVIVFMVMLSRGMGRMSDLELLRARHMALAHTAKFVPTNGHRHDHHHPHGRTGAITELTPLEETAAVLAFVTSTTSNALPALDPSKPLDPSIILDFDFTSSEAQSDMDLLVNEMQSRYPVVLIGKMRDPWHRELKKLLRSYKIRPAPLIIDVDQRYDADVMQPLLARLLESEVLPQMLISLKPLGSYADVLHLRDTGEFAELLAASGASVVQSTTRKKGAKERERQERERLLKPKPIEG